MSQEKADLIVKNASQLLTLRSHKKGPRLGPQMEDLGLVCDGAVASGGGLILAAGSSAAVETGFVPGPEAEVIDAQGKVVTPGFVDAHTHPVFAGSREEEFELRIKGSSYQEIAAAGGGIRASVRSLHQATEEQLEREARPRLDRMLSLGTTTAEAKSGYGLSLAAEIKSLEVIARLNKSHPIELIPTFLGAHEVPEEFQQDRGEYIRQIQEEMIPQVVQRGLAEFCDIFCEQGVFDVEESREILSTAKRAGLKLKLHADELAASGGALLAAELEAVSADHLVFVSPAGIDAMRKAGVIPVLLPGTTFSYPVTIRLPAELPDGDYRLLVGVYLWPAVERLPVLADVPGAEIRAVELRQVRVVLNRR